jgi:hypothetical protein
VIPHIRWDSLRRMGEPLSPFAQICTGRPLRVTLDSASFHKLSGEQSAAVNMLRGFARLDELDIIDTNPGDLGHLIVGPVDEGGDFIPLTLQRDQTITRSGIEYVNQWRASAADLVSKPPPLSKQKWYTRSPEDDPRCIAMFQALLLARAHVELHRDLFVTTSQLLLDRRESSGVSEANPRTPIEALKIVGLFLRSRNNFTYRASESVRCSLHRWMFYRVLAWHLLPAMERYVPTCRRAGDSRNDDTFELAQAVVTRVIRALQARDAIGEQFYGGHDDSIEHAASHFDHLLLLLVGAIDAQARVAHRAYGGQTALSVPERVISFREPHHLVALRDAGAQALYGVLSGPRVQRLLEVLYKFRNTIHGAELAAGMTIRGWNSPGVFNLTEDDGKLLRGLVKQYGSQPVWGLSERRTDNSHGWHLEPYTFAVRMVAELVPLINEIAEATEVERLLPPAMRQAGVPRLPRREPFDPLTSECVGLLA